MLCLFLHIVDIQMEKKLFVVFSKYERTDILVSANLSACIFISDRCSIRYCYPLMPISFFFFYYYHCFFFFIFYFSLGCFFLFLFSCSLLLLLFHNLYCLEKPLQYAFTIKKQYITYIHVIVIETEENKQTKKVKSEQKRNSQYGMFAMMNQLH